MKKRDLMKKKKKQAPMEPPDGLGVTHKKSKRVRSRQTARGALPVKNNITQKALTKFSQNFNKKHTNKVFKNINTKVHFKKLVLKSDYMQNKKRTFKNYINVDSIMTNQESSGRCWLFACLNVMRLPMIKKYKLKNNFEFSQNYLFFYDKLENANYFLNFIIKNKTTKLSDMKLIHLLDTLTNDGGQWHIFVNLIEKYGIVPKTNMDDHFHSKDSHELNQFYNNFLRKAANRLRSNKAHSSSKLVEELLEECYKILVIFLGEPPKKINWEYYQINKKSGKNKYKSVTDITPLDFYKKIVPYDACDKISLINYPCSHVPFYKIYNVDLTFNVLNAPKQQLVNVPIDLMVDAVKKSIDAKEAVYVGADFNQFISNNEGFMDQNGFNYNDIFGFDNIMDKCDSLNYRQSAPNHAIIIRGYNFEKNGKTNGFLVENSWGDGGTDYQFKGNYYMSLEWFKQFVYVVVVDKKHVTKRTADVLKKSPITLPYWSPFGNVLIN